ncbi:pilin [Spongiibacter taiwanensis]|nr:pilin [Spongiibacter taiwanensis]
MAGGLKIQVADVYADTGDLSGIDSNTNGLPVATNVKGKYTSRVDVADGVITATIGGDASATVNGSTITLSPVTNLGSLEWVCKPGVTGTAVEDKYLPSACRS